MKESNSRTYQIGANVAWETSHYVHDCNAPIVNEANVLEPTVVPAPGETQRKDEARGKEGEEDVSINLNALTNWTRSNNTRFHTERQKVDEPGVVEVCVIQSKEEFLPHKSSFSFHGETKTSEEERQGRHRNDQDCLE